MKVVYKKPGERAQLITAPGTAQGLRRVLGGEFETIPALKGCMVLCLAKDEGEAYNVDFLGARYCGPIMIVGRGEHNRPVELSEQLQRVVLKALGGDRRWCGK